MPRFYITEQPDSGIITVTGDDARHMALSLRMRIGEEVILCDGKCSDFRCVVSSIHPDEVVCQVEESFPTPGEPNYFIRLFQGIPKGDKMDSIIQKAVELGVSEVIPVIMARSVSRPDKKSEAKKLSRWVKIAMEAAKQCGRGIVPSVGEFRRFHDILTDIKTEPAIYSLALPLLFYENGGERLREVFEGKKYPSIDVLIGPEGGFTSEEVDAFREHGGRIATLGGLILRTETASSAALAIIRELNE